MIDYKKIADAVSYYSDLGYEYIDVPWIISLDTLLITRTKGARPFSTFAGELVASGEQSFLEIRNKLKLGKYQCVTPCFRDESVHDKLYLQYFVKNELIWVVKDEYMYGLVEIIKDAKAFFGRYGEVQQYDVPLDNAFLNTDIMLNGIGIGSYGIRKVDDFAWVYGTGCAEPRLTQAINYK